jgi:hypothetical protein
MAALTGNSWNTPEMWPRIDNALTGCVLDEHRRTAFD